VWWSSFFFDLCSIVPWLASSDVSAFQSCEVRELILKVIPMPADCNANGDIFGGWVMAQVDLAGSKQPVRVGDILSFFSKVSRIGRTSITVKVEVYAERFSAQGRYIKVTEASVTYVAIDENGKPREIPKV
jgi:acyl-CoA thioesterase YciA